MKHWRRFAKGRWPVSKLRWVLSKLGRALWFRVVLYGALGVAAAIAASLSGRFFAGKAPLDIGADAIDSLLTIIASSMLAVTTFSVGALTSAYGSATSNATPRATSLLTEDGIMQRSLATFVGSFIFAIVGLIALKISFYGPEGRAVLFLVTLAVIVLIVAALMRWIDRLTRLGRVSDTVGRIEDATRRAMDTRLDKPYLGGRGLDTLPEAGRAVTSQAVGYVQFVDTARLSDLTEAEDLDIDVAVLPGTFVHLGSVLARVRGQGALSPETMDRIRGACTIDASRTFDQDPRFGLVVLAEVALRALSPAVNDPGTAIDVIGRQARLLSAWSQDRDEAAGTPPDYPRVGVMRLTDADLFEDAFNLIGRDGAAQIDVMLRLTKTLAALRDCGPDAARRAAGVQLAVAVDRARAALASPHDRDRLERSLKGAG